MDLTLNILELLIIIEEGPVEETNDVGNMFADLLKKKDEQNNTVNSSN